MIYMTFLFNSNLGVVVGSYGLSLKLLMAAKHGYNRILELMVPGEEQVIPMQIT
jgi:hypothetical protein